MQAVQAAFPIRHQPDGLRRTMAMSFAVHVAVVGALFVIPRDWLTHQEPKKITMSLAMGSPGERTKGMNPAGGRPIEEVAPQPKRPTPVPPVAPPQTPVIATAKPPKTPPRPVETPIASTAPPRPPTTGAQKTPGSAAADTRAVGLGTGLQMGGGQSGVSALDTDFCCPEYSEELRRRLWEKWQLVQNQPQTGINVVSFVIRRDGSFVDFEIVQSSGDPMLDIASRSMFRGLKFPPLPDKYKEETLTVRLKLEFKR